MNFWADKNPNTLSSGFPGLKKDVERSRIIIKGFREGVVMNDSGNLGYSRVEVAGDTRHST